MDLIVETDLGHDPDDFFAICYLLACGVKIRAVLVTPGDPDQIALARFISQYTEQPFCVGVSHPKRPNQSSNRFHHDILKNYQ